MDDNQDMRLVDKTSDPSEDNIATLNLSVRTTR